MYVEVEYKERRRRREGQKNEREHIVTDVVEDKEKIVTHFFC